MILWCSVHQNLIELCEIESKWNDIVGGPEGIVFTFKSICSIHRVRVRHQL